MKLGLTVILMLVGFSMIVTIAVYGISLHLYARYIARTHPDLWKQLGAPNLVYGSGPRQLREWIDRERYLRRLDDHLVRHGRRLRKLQRFSYIYFWVGWLSWVLAVLLQKLT